jgi:hypothetical protein
LTSNRGREGKKERREEGEKGREEERRGVSGDGKEKSEGSEL